MSMMMGDTLPRRLNTAEDLACYQARIAEIALVDPIQAICYLRWMLDNVWERWYGLDYAVKMSMESKKG
jgi:hypothetical protein